MIYSVGMQQRWMPEQIDSLYIDAQDLHGLEYWYDNVAQYAKEMEDAAKGKKNK